MHRGMETTEDLKKEEGNKQDKNHIAIFKLYKL